MLAVKREGQYKTYNSLSHMNVEALGLQQPYVCSYRWGPPFSGLFVRNTILVLTLISNNNLSITYYLRVATTLSFDNQPLIRVQRLWLQCVNSVKPSEYFEFLPRHPEGSAGSGRLHRRERCALP